MIKNGPRENWVSGASFITPAGCWHSHHNESGEDAHVLPIQMPDFIPISEPWIFYIVTPATTKPPTFPSGLELQGLATIILFEFDFTLDQYTFIELFQAEFKSFLTQKK